MFKKFINTISKELAKLVEQAKSSQTLSLRRKNNIHLIDKKEDIDLEMSGVASVGLEHGSFEQFAEEIDSESEDIESAKESDKEMSQVGPDTSKKTGSVHSVRQRVLNTVNPLSDKRIYADYASLTPIDPRVIRVVSEAMAEYTANPSSLYTEGVKAKKALEDARLSVASHFGLNKDEVIFTSGGTEANNLAFYGLLSAFETSELRKKLGSKAKPHIVISTIEHPSIIELSLALIEQGYDISFVPVSASGIVDPRDIRKVLKPETILVSIMYANNEIGTIQPIKEITREVRHFKKTIERSNQEYPFVHTDASQAVLYEDMRIPGLNVDLMTIDGGKVYGPRGIGALLKRRYVPLVSMMHGGGQEAGLRPGTEHVAAVIGLKHALDIAHTEKDDEKARLKELRETLIELLMSKINPILTTVSINGDIGARLPNNINICFPGLDAEFLVLRLDVLGLAVSSVTSCRGSDEDSSSYVIEALGKSDCALSSLRITLGRNTTASDIGIIAERVAQAVREQVEQG
ncbi:MAG: hypothetical protein RIQ72_674 [Candidatus Parcubacteria bacterium]|jgi:cysteine desulfurase